MLLSDRRRFFVGLVGLFALGACNGFSPVYGTGGQARQQIGAIRPQDPSDKNTFDLVKHLEGRLGFSENPAFDLNYTLETSTQEVGTGRDGKTNRFLVNGKVVWSLIRRTDGGRVAGGVVQNFTAYTTTNFSIAEIAAEEAAYGRLMRILADQMVTQLFAQTDKLAS